MTTDEPKGSGELHPPSPTRLDDSTAALVRALAAAGYSTRPHPSAPDDVGTLVEALERDGYRIVRSPSQSLSAPTGDGISLAAARPLLRQLTGLPLGLPDLGPELLRLQRSRGAGLHEATILYAGRIAELLFRSVYVHTKVRAFEAADSLAKIQWNLELIGLATPRMLIEAHALRRLCNAVRHANDLRRGQPLDLDDVSVALEVLEQILTWTIRLFGPPSPSLSLGLPARSPGPASHLLRLKRQVLRHRSLSEQLGCIDAFLTAHPMLAQASDVLQLRGLVLSRLHRFEDALALLEPLYRQRDPQFPDDLGGIIGGIYKRRWQVSRATRDLDTALERYSTLYSDSNKGNLYAGINKAALLYWRGAPHDHARAVKIARRLRGNLPREHELASLQTRFVGLQAGTGLWALFTRAEALLLIGMLDADPSALWEATRQYEGALEVARTSSRHSDAESALNQLRFHLQLAHCTAGSDLAEPMALLESLAGC